MDFSASSTKNIYSDRLVHEGWMKWCESTLNPNGKDVADIGCGGGIYTRAFAKLGARTVTGIDSSEQYVNEATNSSIGNESISYLVGDASRTELEDDAVDIVFERALIHHLTATERGSNLDELKRILRRSGTLAIQDRTFEDVVSDSPNHWIRATLFKCFPKLLEFEKSRRPTKSNYSALVKSKNFSETDTITFSEVRKVYTVFEDLEEEILTRKGKSILFELNDRELQRYCSSLRKISLDKKLEEIDKWTIWIAKTL